MPSARTDQKTTRFCYDDNPKKPGSVDRRMVGSFFLDYFGKLTTPGGECVSFPLSRETLKSLGANLPERIVVYDQDPVKVQSVVNELNAISSNYYKQDQFQLKADTEISKLLNITILESHEMPETCESTLYSVNDWIPGELSRAFIKKGSKIEFVSKGKKWSVVSCLKLGKLHKRSRIRISYKIISGRVRFLIQGSGDYGMWFCDKWPSNKIDEVIFEAASDLNEAELLLLSMYPNGSSSQVQIMEVSRSINTVKTLDE
jgi:hypothetical protein